MTITLNAPPISVDSISTSYSPKLPLECIQCVISHLDGDIFTLFHLLTVHSSFFKATLPILYRDPYRALEKQIQRRNLLHYRKSKSIFAYSTAAKKLLYTLLLSCRRSDDLVPFLTPDWRDPISPFVTADQPLMACYVDYLGDLDYDRWAHTLKSIAPDSDNGVGALLMRLLRIIFLDHHAERVQTLLIPVTHLAPYKPLLPRLKNLRWISFYEDGLDGTHDQAEDQNEQEQQAEDNTQRRNGNEGVDGNNIQEQHQDQPHNNQGQEQAEAEAAQAQNEAEQTNQEVVADQIVEVPPPGVNEIIVAAGNEPIDPQPGTSPSSPVPASDPASRGAAFLKLHRELFGSKNNVNHSSPSDHHQPGSGLQGVTAPRGWNSSDDARYLGLLKALQSPANIDFQDWRHPPTLSDIPLNGIKRIRSFNVPALMEATWSQGELLQQCRSLERFCGQIKSSPSAFAWAVKEHEERTLFENLVLKGCASVASQNAGLRLLGPVPDPVPLRKIHLGDREANDPIIPVLRDVCLAFSSTLVSVQVRIRFTVCEVPLGLIHDMPHLTRLEIFINSPAYFTCNVGFLKGCSTLEHIHLESGNEGSPTSPSYDELGSLQEPWYLPKLKHLRIIGPVCTIFNYETFINTPNVRSIHLDHVLHKDYLSTLSQPSWSWNWNMSALGSLWLKGHAAHLFQLSFLERCPNLKRLHLDLDRAPRVVSESRDAPLLAAPRFESPVHSLTLTGRWEFMHCDSNIFLWFMRTWFSNVRYLKMGVPRIPSNRWLMEGLLSLKHLRKSNIRGCRLSGYELWEFGLKEAAPKAPHDWDQKSRVQFIEAEARRRRELFRISERQLEHQEQRREQRRCKNFDPWEETIAPAFSSGLFDFPEEDTDAKVDEDGYLMERKQQQLKERAEGEAELEMLKKKREKEAQEDQGFVKAEVHDRLRCIYVFKGKRYQVYSNKILVDCS
ncbi:hypothetical protein BX616_006798 [Lobosporangium transversale]|nr:hypothetical protein BX616_006798 [Lobosporangium transversale]